MPRVNRIFLVLVLALAAIPLAQLAGGALGENVTVLEKAMPAEARPGDVVNVTGYALDAAHLKEIYLTNGELDYRLEILEQSSQTVRLRVPANIPAGQMRFGIVVATRPELLEQPVLLKILPAAT
jgi:hypothetical protein